jgi:hypothetical protein
MGARTTPFSSGAAPHNSPSIRRNSGVRELVYYALQGVDETRDSSLAVMKRLYAK